MDSHRRLLEFALKSGFEFVFVMEDDIDFCDNFKEKLSECMHDLPNDWDGMHLGGYSRLNNLKSYSNNLWRCYSSCGGYGYIVRSKAIPKILERTESKRHQFDIHLSVLMHELNWFKSKEMLIKHLPGFSDIQGKFVDYKQLY